MENSAKLTKYLLVLVAFILTPITLVLIALTHGRLLPHLGTGDTWNIQYLLPAGISILPVVAMRFPRYRAVIGTRWYCVLTAWNCLLAAFFIWATIELWGEMY